MSFESTLDLPPDAFQLMDEFRDTMPDEILDELPPLRDIRHAIYLVIGS